MEFGAKVGVAVAPSDGRRVYALIEADQGGFFRPMMAVKIGSVASGKSVYYDNARGITPF